MSSIQFTPTSKTISRPIWAMTTLPALAAGLGLLLSFPGQAKADTGVRSSGHVEVTVGFPNGEVNVGKTWETGDRREITQQESSRHDVTIIEQRGEPRHCEREVVVERRYEAPACPRREVVGYSPRPERAVYAPVRMAIVDPPRHIARDYRRNCEPARFVVSERRYYEGRNGYHGRSVPQDRNDHRRPGNRG
jgi:hypothetical protein